MSCPSKKISLRTFLLCLGLGLPFCPSLFADTTPAASCRPEGLYQTPGQQVPYETVYDSEGREKLANGLQRRVIGYFTSWRTGTNGQTTYLANHIPWNKLSHINYAFGHIDEKFKVSVGDDNAKNAATGMTWPDVKGAEMDPEFPYKGHFNLLNKYKKQHAGVKTLISVGGWAESGGINMEDGSRKDTGGFFTMTCTESGQILQNNINTFADSAVEFIRKYGFDGLDIDWEYASSMKDSGNPLDFKIANARRLHLPKAYVALMKTLREKLDAASVADKKHYLLSIAASSSGWLLRGHETYQVCKYLDFINLMSYDLHGAWNEFVGPNATLFDDGKDTELIRWDVYKTPEFGGIGYLNTDWAYHYYRGSVQAGRINIGVPYYTRGWTDLDGTTNGLWAKAKTKDKSGAKGLENLWHDIDKGEEVASGGNPMWHAKNLEKAILGSYLPNFKFPADTKIQGVYERHYDKTLVAPWLWNSTTKTFLSMEDEESTTTKADYIIDRGIGGVMFWELAGDYAFFPNQGKAGEYYIGDTLTSIYYDKFKSAKPYGNKLSNTTMPSKAIDVTVEFTNYKVGEECYPIAPKVKITNKSKTALPSGTVIEFDVPTSMAPILKGNTVTVKSKGHEGNNIGGLKGDFHRLSLTTKGNISAGGNQSVDITYYLPISGPINITVSVKGTQYATKDEYPDLPTAF